MPSSASSSIITGAALNGNNLEITEAGVTTSVDLSSLSGDATTVTDGSTVDLNLTGSAISAEVKIDPASGNILSSSASGLMATEVDGSTANELITGAALNGNNLEITEVGNLSTVDLSSLADEYNTSVSLTGTTLNIVDGGGTKSVNLSSIASGAEVGTIANNYLPKWSSSSSQLVQSTSVYEDPSGNVGIGTTTIPGVYKLAVNGSMVATELKVKLQANWPDYVFEKDYPLVPLPELEKSIQQMGHLPDIPSAGEVKANDGMEVGKMQVLLLEKVEELTLYIIQLEKRIQELEAKK
jgi:hypothetical protein